MPIKPKRTFSSVTKELVDGLEDGTITLRQEPAQYLVSHYGDYFGRGVSIDSVGKLVDQPYQRAITRTGLVIKVLPGSIVDRSFLGIPSIQASQTVGVMIPTKVAKGVKRGFGMSQGYVLINSLTARAFYRSNA
jgi:hypothetical protein